MGVRVTAPPRTESSIRVPMATNPVTRRLAFNSMNPHPVGAMRPVKPDGQVALHFTHLVIFAQRMHPTNHTRDDHVWAATLEENWSVNLWPALFKQAGEPDLSTMTHLRFKDPNDHDRARFPLLLQPANAHREAHSHTVLIADTGSRSYPDHANPAHLAAADVPAARVGRVLSRISRYAGAGSRGGRV
eukprot:1690822-Pleurochrysis_carterae.AAC.1